MTDALGALSEAGVSIWLDDLSRDRLRSGSLAGLAAHDHVVGVTTNPSKSSIAGHRLLAPGPHHLSDKEVSMLRSLRACGRRRPALATAAAVRSTR